MRKTIRLILSWLLLSTGLTCAFGFEAYRVSDESWERVREYYRKQVEGITDEQIDMWRDYAVEEDPGPRPEIGNEALAEQGYCDVTSEPFGADPTGKADSTEAIRKAVRYARSYRLAVFFPAGDYLISDMLHCHQARVIREGNYKRGELQPVGAPVVMVGSTKDPEKRARLILKENSPGFGDPKKPKYVVLINNIAGPNTKGRTPLNYDSSTVNYDNYFGGIDIVVEEGNDGAIGLRMRGAEGTGITDVTVDLRKGGMTGMQCAGASGGSHHGITVLGGKIGISTADWLPGMPYDHQESGTQPGPTLSGIRLIGQSEWALINNSRGQLVMVGTEIESAKRGPVVKVILAGDIFAGCLAMIDSRVSYETPDAANSVFEADRSVYARDLFVENGGKVEEGVELGEGWKRLKELAISREPKRYGQAQKAETPIWIDGEEFEEPVYFVDGGKEEPPLDLVAKHGWGEELSFESEGVVNAKEHGVIGDGEADDAAALQAVIDEHERVFLPKGEYKLKATLRLKPETKLFGVHSKFSTIHAVENRKEGRFGGENPDPAKNGRTAIETADDAAAKTYLGFLGLHTDAVWDNHSAEPMGLYSLKWQCGPKSVVRQIAIGPRMNASWNVHKVLGAAGHDEKSIRKDTPRFLNIYDAFSTNVAAIKHHPVLVTGNGGGNWFNFWFHGYYPYDKHVRLMKIDGTRHPFRVYHLHGQHTHAAAVFEIHGAENVDIFGTKSEFHTRFMDIIDSRKVRIYGMGGAFGPGMDVEGKRQPFYRFVNCEDFLLAALGQEVSTWGRDHVVIGGGRFPLVKLPIDSYDPFTVDGEGVVPRQARPILFKRGKP